MGAAEHSVRHSYLRFLLALRSSMVRSRVCVYGYVCVRVHRSWVSVGLGAAEDLGRKHSVVRSRLWETRQTWL